MKIDDLAAKSAFLSSRSTIWGRDRRSSGQEGRSHPRDRQSGREIGVPVDGEGVPLVREGVPLDRQGLGIVSGTFNVETGRRSVLQAAFGVFEFRHPAEVAVLHDHPPGLREILLGRLPRILRLADS